MYIYLEITKRKHVNVDWIDQIIFANTNKQINKSKKQKNVRKRHFILTWGNRDHFFFVCLSLSWHFFCLYTHSHRHNPRQFPSYQTSEQGKARARLFHHYSGLRRSPSPSLFTFFLVIFLFFLSFLLLSRLKFTGDCLFLPLSSFLSKDQEILFPLLQ